MSFDHDAVAALPVSSNADKALIRALTVKRFAYCLDASENASDFVAIDPDAGTIPLYLLQNGILFQYDSTDTTTDADGITCLVTSDGKRYKYNNPISFPTGAGAITGAIKSDGTGAFSQASANDLSNGVIGTGAVVLASELGSGANKIISLTRDLTLATGNVSYTGVGFQPTALFALGCPTATNTDTANISIGMSDASKNANDLAYGLSTGQFRIRSDLLFLGGSSSFQRALVSSYDTDGFTLAWTKSGTPTGTAQCYILCMR